jgi:hypothetical protein
MRKIASIGVSVISLGALFMSGCSEEKYPWEGLVYPKTGQMPYDLAIGHYATIEECRASAIAILSKTHPEEGATPDYECGYKCKVSDVAPPPGQLAMRTCEKTEK